MTVKVVREPYDFDDSRAENCCKCGKPTRYWHQRNDVPLCIPCSKKYGEKDIPAKLVWIKMEI